MRFRPRQYWSLSRLALMFTVVVAAIALFAVVPRWIAQRMNPVLGTLTPISDESVLELHRQLTIADLHADSLLWGRDLLKQDTIGHVDIPRLIQGNVALQIFSSVTKVPSPLKLEGNRDRNDDIIKLALIQRWPFSTWFSLHARAEHMAKTLSRVERRSKETFTVIRSRQELDAYLLRREHHPEITAGLLSVEGAQALDGKLENLDRLYKSGFRMIGLTHFYDNEVGGSQHGVSGAGLSDFGRQVVSQMLERHMIIDLAHASPQVMDDVFAMTNHPLVVSHTGVQGTCPNSRNLSDRQLEQIANSGGLVGIGFWSTAICGDSVEDIVRAMRYVSDRVGVEHVSLGSDFDGSVGVPFDVSNMAQLTQALKQNGFNDDEIGAIMGENVIRLLRSQLP